MISSQKINLYKQSSFNTESVGAFFMSSNGICRKFQMSFQPGSDGLIALNGQNGFKDILNDEHANGPKLGIKIPVVELRLEVNKISPQSPPPLRSGLLGLVRNQNVSPRSPQEFEFVLCIMDKNQAHFLVSLETGAFYLDPSIPSLAEHLKDMVWVEDWSLESYDPKSDSHQPLAFYP